MSGEILHASCLCGFSLEIHEGLQPTGEYLLPAVCEECREFLVIDYHHPRCLGCGKRPIFYGEMDHKFFNFVLYEEKHKLPKMKRYHSPAYSECTLAAPMAGNLYGCPKCRQKSLVFSYDGFWK